MKKIISVLLLSLSSLPVLAENYNHSGIYLGLSGQNIRSENQVKTAHPDPSFSECGHYAFGCSEDLNMNNWSISPLIGIQKQLSNNIVIGIEGKYDFSSLNKNKISSQNNSGLEDADTGSVKIKNIASISAKFGYVIQNSNVILNDALIYGKVGYANLKSDTDLSDGITFSTPHRMEGSFVRHHGVIYGLGVEKPLSFISDTFKNTLIGIEYNHINFNTKNNNAIDATGIDDPGVLTKPSIDSIGIKLQHKFNVL
jgi:opacity protein-like surface antigen